MNFVNKAIFLFLTFFSIQSFCKESLYQKTKKRITKLENSIIQEYSCSLPEEGTKLTQKEQIYLVSKVKTRYNIQKSLFYKIEEELLELGHKISGYLKNKQIDQKEFKELKNGIEYANRIILQSRKKEIDSIFLQFLGRISYKPALSDIMDKLHQINGEQCEVTNISLNEEDGHLSFQIMQKNSFGNLLSSPFIITNDDITSGHLSTQIESRHKFNPFHNIVTNYSKIRATHNQKSSFTFLQNEDGAIEEAHFSLEKDVPLISIFGLKFGKQKVKQNFNCAKPKQKASRLPASLK